MEVGKENIKTFIQMFWSKKIKFSLGEYNFIFMWRLGSWYIPLFIYLPNWFTGDDFWGDYGIGILCFYLEWSHNSKMWSKIMWETDD